MSLYRRESTKTALGVGGKAEFKSLYKAAFGGVGVLTGVFIALDLFGLRMFFSCITWSQFVIQSFVCLLFLKASQGRSVPVLFVLYFVSILGIIATALIWVREPVIFYFLDYYLPRPMAYVSRLFVSAYQLVWFSAGGSMIDASRRIAASSTFWLVVYAEQVVLGGFMVLAFLMQPKASIGPAKNKHNKLKGIDEGG